MSVVGKWLIFGHRRWANVIVGELSRLLPKNHVIDIYLGDEENARIWKLSNTNIQLNPIFEIPTCDINQIGVAIIANSALMHLTSINSALDAGYHVVCEKPLTFSESDTLSLLKKSTALDKRIFPSNTFVFADYMHVLKRKWISKLTFTDINIDWFDAKSELRYGMNKRYDSSVPIFYDVLPHITSILFVLIGHIDLSNFRIKVDGGGSEVNLSMSSKDMNVIIKLSRMSEERKRMVKFKTKDEELTFDFTIEPGWINNNNRTVSIVDNHWNEKRKPIAEMLSSVIHYFDNGFIDERFSMFPTLMANQIADKVCCDYVAQQLDYLRHSEQRKMEENEYILKEIKALKQRALNYLPTSSPLIKLIREADKNNLLNH